MLKSVANPLAAIGGYGVVVVSGGAISTITPGAVGQVITSTDGSTFVSALTTSNDPIFTWQTES